MPPSATHSPGAATRAGSDPVCGRAMPLVEESTLKGRSELAKTILDHVAAAVGLIVLSPVFLVAAAMIVLEDRLPVFFRQERVGRNFRRFRLVKLRSMRSGVSGSRITAGQDPRLTRVGRTLRRYKIDELPQLWNVLRGEMSLVGPRPEVPAFVDPVDPVWRAVLRAKPGITDLASLVYRNEEEALGAVTDPEQCYRDSILPAKLALNLHYMRVASFWLDLKLIFLSVRYSFLPAGFDSSGVLGDFSK